MYPRLDIYCIVSVARGGHVLKRVRSSQLFTIRSNLQHCDFKVVRVVSSSSSSYRQNST